MVLLSAAMCFASGAREIADDETIVKVIAIDIEDDGVYRATVQTGDGTVIVYRASEEETVCSVPFEQIHVGSVLAVKDNGIMTMSIPAQMWATEIRDITLGVGAGAYDITFAEPEGVYADVIAEENAGADLWPMSVADDLASRFSYSYAYDLVVGYASQGVIFRGPYYVRGIMDFWNGSEPLTPLQSMAEDVNLYIDTIFMNGVAETTGPAPSSMDEIEAITSFEDISQRFSYAYGYASAYQDYMSGITVDLEDYVNGALTAVYGGTPLLDEDEQAARPRAITAASASPKILFFFINLSYVFEYFFLCFLGQLCKSVHQKFNFNLRKRKLGVFAALAAAFMTEYKRFLTRKKFYQL